MVDAIFKLMDNLQPLRGRRSPGLAAALGFMFGGIGLGLYFLSFVDFIVPIGIAIAASVMFTGFATAPPGVGVLAGAVVAALWGYCRADNSNRRRRLDVTRPAAEEAR